MDVTTKPSHPATTTDDLFDPLMTTTTTEEELTNVNLDETRMNEFGPTMNPMHSVGSRRPTTRIDTSLEMGYDYPTEEIPSTDASQSTPRLSSILTTTEPAADLLTTTSFVNVLDRPTQTATCNTNNDCVGGPVGLLGEVKMKCVLHRCHVICSSNSTNRDCYKGIFMLLLNTENTTTKVFTNVFFFYFKIKTYI